MLLLYNLLNSIVIKQRVDKHRSVERVLRSFRNAEDMHEAEEDYQEMSRVQSRGKR